MMPHATRDQASARVSTTTNFIAMRGRRRNRLTKTAFERFSREFGERDAPSFR
jgi:hypothetical protein